MDIPTPGSFLFVLAAFGPPSGKEAYTAAKARPPLCAERCHCQRVGRSAYFGKPSRHHQPVPIGAVYSFACTRPIHAKPLYSMILRHKNPCRHAKPRPLLIEPATKRAMKPIGLSWSIRPIRLMQTINKIGFLS